jgi:2-amino-4-hydroxy-6-hydroxymethyldihydropteridine diphosphokinase
LNQAVLLSSDLTPSDLMTQLLQIEKELGRERSPMTAGYQSRLIDIDQLACDSIVSNDTHITLPHPALHLRRFALLPMKEIQPNWHHPISKKSISVLIEECKDSSEIHKL